MGAAWPAARHRPSAERPGRPWRAARARLLPSTRGEERVRRRRGTWGTAGVAAPEGRQRKGQREGPEDGRQATLPFYSVRPSLLSTFKKKKKNPLRAGSFPASGGTKPCGAIGCGAKTSTSLPRGQARGTATHCSDTSLYPAIPEAELRQGHWHDFKTSLSYSVRKTLSSKNRTHRSQTSGMEGWVSRKERWETVIPPFKTHPGPHLPPPSPPSPELPQSLESSGRGVGPVPDKGSQDGFILM